MFLQKRNEKVYFFTALKIKKQTKIFSLLSVRSITFERDLLKNMK